MNKIQLLLCSMAVCGSSVALATEAPEPTQEQNAFMQAREALALGQNDIFAALKDELKDYLLHPYLEYEGLQHEIRTTKPGQAFVSKLNEFEQYSQDPVLTKKVTRSLQSRLLETEQWKLFLGVSKSSFAARMPCGRLRALSETGQTIGFDNADYLKIWTSASEPDEICSDLVAKVEAKNTPPIKAIWDRIYSAMEADKPDRAEPLLRFLNKRDRERMKQWMAAAKDPKKYFFSIDKLEETAHNRIVVADLVMAWSQNEPVEATRYWHKVKDQYQFSKEISYDTSRALAMRAAYRRLPEAYEFLNSFTANEDDLELKEWRVRTALLAQNWAEVFKSIRALPAEEQEEDHWAYWIARAREKAGDAERANEIYQELAELQSYHGFLAADRLGIPYTLRDEPLTGDPAIVARLKKLPAAIKAREYHRVNVRWEGRREWNKAIKDSTPEELLAFAQIAKEWHLHDRAIFAAGKAEQRRALSFRFPVLYQSEVDKASAKNSIDPAWVYGVMRRESAYIPDVQSGAGARGLMQLMPRTAEYVAKLQGEDDWDGDLNDPETNIGLGSHYLRHVLDKFDDHVVLATASYNAGPHRVSKWLPAEDMLADIWIDAIPYSETRRYVRAVLAYTAIYEWQLHGEAERLSDKLTNVLAETEVVDRADKL